MATSWPEQGNELLVELDHEHSWQKLVRYLRVKTD
jgi:hypothetical protein